MKTIVTVVCAAGALLAYGADLNVQDCAGECGGGLMPVKRLAASRHEALSLVENGKLNFAIVGRFKEERDFRGPEGQSLAKFKRDSLKHAADTLVWAFQGCFGAKPEILEEDNPKVKSCKYVIALGNTHLASELGIVPERLPREGFEIKTCAKGVVIAGMDGFRIPGFYDRFNWRCSRITCNGTEWARLWFFQWSCMDVRVGL